MPELPQVKSVGVLDSQLIPIESEGNQSSCHPAIRDWRLDFFRGIALLVIFVDHVEWFNGDRLTSNYTLGRLGFCDAAEVFIFISGYVCGMSYGRVLGDFGFIACLRKVLKRCSLLYVANLGCVLIVINLVCVFGSFGIGHFSGYRLNGLDLPITDLVPLILFQFYQPVGFDILWLYVHMLLVLPLFFAGLKRRKWITWFVVAVCYGVAQTWPSINYPQFESSTGELSGSARTFNHLAWQLLFLIGAVLGDWKKRGGSIAVPRWVSAVCGICVFAVAGCRIAHDHISWSVLDGISAAIDKLAYSPWCTKRTLGVVRIVYFLSLVCFVASAIRVTSNLRNTRPVRLLMNCGHNPLPIFCIGLVLTFAFHPVLASFPGSQFMLIVSEVTGCAAMLIAGSVISGSAKTAESKIT